MIFGQIVVLAMNKCGFNRPKLENESFIMVDSGKNRSQFLVYNFLYIYNYIYIYICTGKDGECFA